jgi:hypothetical protein
VASDPQLDANYYPIWNTTTKSPCIDNGDPDLNANGIPWYLDPEDQDPDGTRKDIGAYHNPDQHINGFHRLNNYEVKYISIPGGKPIPVIREETRYSSCLIYMKGLTCLQLILPSLLEYLGFIIQIQGKQRHSIILYIMFIVKTATR